MNQYLSIGKVSKMKNVSIKSLRYYDKIGILKPAFVNAETNYRYYTEEQLYLLDAVRQKHISAQHAVMIFMQNAGGIGDIDSPLLCGNEKFENILSVIFRCIHVFQRNGHDRPGRECILVKTIRQHQAGFAFRYTHMAGSVQEEMKEVLRSNSFCIIETDTSSARNKKNGYPFELQYLVDA